MNVSTHTVINGKRVEHGDTIISSRGDEYTFDYAVDDRIVTKERPYTNYLHRVFVDRKERVEA